MDRFDLHARIVTGSLFNRIGNFEVYKNGELWWHVSIYHGVKRALEVRTKNNKTFVCKRKGNLLFSNIFAIYEDGLEIYEIKRRAISSNGKKVKLDGRNFVYCESEKLCSIDRQDERWNSDKTLIKRWEHNRTEYAEIISFLALFEHAGLDD